MKINQFARRENHVLRTFIDGSDAAHNAYNKPVVCKMLNDPQCSISDIRVSMSPIAKKRHKVWTIRKLAVYFLIVSTK